MSIMNLPDISPANHDVGVFISHLAVSVSAWKSSLRWGEWLVPKGKNTLRLPLLLDSPALSKLEPDAQFLIAPSDDSME